MGEQGNTVHSVWVNWETRCTGPRERSTRSTGTDTVTDKPTEYVLTPEYSRSPGCTVEHDLVPREHSELARSLSARFGREVSSKGLTGHTADQPISTYLPPMRRGAPAR